MGRFHEDTALADIDGVLTADLSKDWEIWGPNGGYVSAIALRAAGTLAPKGHRPASFTCQYLSVGAFGPAQATARVLKAGRSAVCIAVELSQEGKVFLMAQVWTTNRDAGPEMAATAYPDVQPAADLHPMEHYLPPDAPKHPFWVNFETRPTVWIPWGQQIQPGEPVRQWQRFKDFEPVDVFADCARLLVLIDTPLWAAHRRAQPPEADYIAPSLDLAVWFHEDPRGSAWLLSDARSEKAHGGLIHGSGQVWSEDGRLLASGGGQMLHTPMRR